MKIINSVGPKMLPQVAPSRTCIEGERIQLPESNNWKLLIKKIKNPFHIQKWLGTKWCCSFVIIVSPSECWYLSIGTFFYCLNCCTSWAAGFAYFLLVKNTISLQKDNNIWINILIENKLKTGRKHESMVNRSFLHIIK